MHGSDNASRAFLLIPTHTVRHLAACVAAVGAQTRPPEGVVVSCDTDDGEIGALLDGIWPRVVGTLRARSLGAPVLLQMSRAHKGLAHPGQVRNNGLRALDSEFGLRETDLVIGIDGDIVLGPDALERHIGLARAGAEVIIPFRVNLDPGATARVTPELVLGGGAELAALTPRSELDSLLHRHARYERHRRVRAVLPRRLADLLIKAHKPKIISAHYAVAVGPLRAINGFDEGFTGYGYEDDDLGRRLHAVGARVAIAVKDILAYHLWHPSRAPARPTDAPGYARFRQAYPARADQGWSDPAAQPIPAVRIVSGS